MGVSLHPHDSMSASIIGRFISKSSGWSFPVVELTEVQSDSDYQLKIKDTQVNQGVETTVTDSLSSIKGTYFGELIAFALTNENKTSKYYEVAYETKDVGSVKYYTGCKLYQGFPESSGLFYCGIRTDYESSFSNAIQANLNEDYYEFYRATFPMVLHIPVEDTFVLVGAYYIINPNGYASVFGLTSNARRAIPIFGFSDIPVKLTSDIGEYIEGPYIPPGPYDPGGPSGPGDNPPGTFDKTSDAIPDSTLPTLSMADTGFTRIFNPTLDQVQNLASYMWKTEDIFETLWNKVKQVFENPMDVMIALNIVPVPVPNSSPVDFTIMYIPTGVMISPATTQFVDVDCGSFDLKGYYGSALDFSPYTKVHCYLPYIGMVTLDTDEVMNNTISVKYRVDIVSGGCVAKILVSGNVLYQYSGHCSVSVPFSASDFSSYMNAMLQVSALALGAAGAGASALGALGAAEAAQETSKVVRTVKTTTTQRNPQTGRQITMGTQTQEVSVPEQSQTQASFAGLSPQNITNTVGQVMSGKPIAQHSGSFNGNTGYLGVRYPYLVIEVPRQCFPSSYQKLNGYPSMITLHLSECSGYTRVQQIQLTELGQATNPEQAEILQLLKGGVIL